MSNKQIEEAFIAIMQKNLPEADLSAVTADTKINSIEELTSLELVMILYDAETDFGVQINDPSGFLTVGDICAFIAKSL